MARLGKLATLMSIAGRRKVGTVTVAATLATAAAIAGGFVLLSPGPSSAASSPKPGPVPVSGAQIRSEMLKGEFGLARQGIFEDERALSRNWVRSLSPAQRAGLVKRLEQQIRSQRAKPLPKAPALKAGLFSIKGGVGPWVPAPSTPMTCT
jgi:hypothetical protein